ncbi:MAG: TATA-box-binding protein, partial [Deltaproteobacteria bacterium]|nr:TATA-box-binding protein [Deltaproteobacteria bacterium]
MDLDYIAYNMPETYFNPGEFPALSLMIDHPKSAALVFSSGKVVITGPKDVNTATDVLADIGIMLQEIGIDVYQSPPVEIVNIVGHTQLDNKINLHMIAPRLQNSNFEPAKFPGIVYNYSEDVNVLIFQSGKLVETGAKSMTEMEEAINNTSTIIGELML